jgi:uncharacterized protein (DUF2252 family)
MLSSAASAARIGRMVAQRLPKANAGRSVVEPKLNQHIFTGCPQMALVDDSPLVCPAQEVEGGGNAKQLRLRGKRLRSETPRSAHAEWKPDVRNELTSRLQAVTADSIDYLIPIRFGRMAESPLAFFRGVPLLMAEDLASTPRSGISVQACGDAHLLNFGLFASPERKLLFDINDFDESLEGPWEWDVKRLATSVVIAGREFGLKEGQCQDSAEACVRSYRGNIEKFSRMSVLDVWYSRVTGSSVLRLFPNETRSHVANRIEKAHKRNNRRAVAELAKDESGRLRFKEDVPVTVHAPELLSDACLTRILESYRESLQEDRRRLFDSYRVVDHVLKVVGVGSVGTRCYAVLFGSDHKNDCMILQLKEATPSVIEGLGGPTWSGNQGRRVVVGQRLIQGFSDIFLGWGSDGKRDYYVRQLRDMKGQLDPLGSSAGGLSHYAELCGWVLARAHARYGAACDISGYLGKSDVFDRAVAEFAILYADQNEHDFSLFRKAIKSGDLPADLET